MFPLAGKLAQQHQEAIAKLLGLEEAFCLVSSPGRAAQSSSTQTQRQDCLGHFLPGQLS